MDNAITTVYIDGRTVAGREQGECRLLQYLIRRLKIFHDIGDLTDRERGANAEGTQGFLAYTE